MSQSLRCAAAIAAFSLCLSTTGCPFVAAGAALGAGTGGAVARAGLSDSSDASGAAIPAKAAIRITLDAPRDLASIHQTTNDTTWVRGVELLIGRVEQIRGDTIRLLATEARLADGSKTTFPRNRAVVLVPRDSRMAIHVINLRPAVTEGVTIGAGIGFLVVAVVLGALLWHSGA